MSVGLFVEGAFVFGGFEGQPKRKPTIWGTLKKTLIWRDPKPFDRSNLTMAEQSLVAVERLTAYTNFENEGDGFGAWGRVTLFVCGVLEPFSGFLKKGQKEHRHEFEGSSFFF